jgi:hypothetical protein
LIKLLLVLLTLFSVTAQADLLDRVHLEAALQERLRDTFKMYDDTAKILVRIEFHGYSGALPGTTVSDISGASPDKIDWMDITKVYVDVYTTLEKVPPEAQTSILLATPIKDKSRITVAFKKFDLTYMNNSKAIEVKDLSQIMEVFVDKLSKIFGTIFGVIFACGFLLFALVSYMQSSRGLQEFRSQIKLLVDAVGNQSMANAGPATLPKSDKPQAAREETAEASSFEHWSTESLKEIFADSYWTEQDGYAHWLWKNISGAQRQDLIENLRFLEEYCTYFVEIDATAYSFHEHPYYLQPSKLALFSQSDLSAVISKTLGVWHIVSPMRKQKLSLTLNEKVEALQTKAADKSFRFPPTVSILRKLDVKSNWGELSDVDEQAIFNDPNVVPLDMRRNIRSLVWLAQKDKAFIHRTLEKFDARSLASAWIGPADMLKVLQSSLPEKKLKLVLSYRSRVYPNRESDAYQLLVDEGLKDVA